MQFTKYHGLGNDFVVVDLRDTAPNATPSPEDPAVVRALCDRQFGVGGDGVLAILPPLTAGSDARMRVLNADGGEAEMCGNGLRCVVKHLWEHDETLRKPALTIDTGAGPLTCRVEGDGVVELVRVDMGRPRMTRHEIPMTGPATQQCIEVPLAVGERTLALTGVSMGNPHAIAFVEETGSELLALATSIGPTVETHEWFPRKTNAEFARMVSPNEIELVVWERGVGITLACGTGACATAVAACLTGRAEPGSDIRVQLLGGDLVIQVAPAFETVFMTGPAARVFEAEIDLDAALRVARPGA